MNILPRTTITELCRNFIGSAAFSIFQIWNCCRAQINVALFLVSPCFYAWNRNKKGASMDFCMFISAKLILTCWSAKTLKLQMIYKSILLSPSKLDFDKWPRNDLDVLRRSIDSWQVGMFTFRICLCLCKANILKMRNFKLSLGFFSSNRSNITKG